MITNVRLHQIENSPLGELARNIHACALYMFTRLSVRFPRTHTVWWDWDNFGLMETQPKYRDNSPIIAIFHELDQDFSG